RSRSAAAERVHAARVLEPVASRSRPDATVRGAGHTRLWLPAQRELRDAPHARRATSRTDVVALTVRALLRLAPGGTMRWAIVIPLLGLVGCTSTVKPLDDCHCASGLVCCPGTQVCTTSVSSCSEILGPRDLALPSPDLSSEDMSSPPDMTPPPDLLHAPHFAFDPPTVTFANAIANHDHL